jgi:hypothetical protein
MEHGAVITITKPDVMNTCINFDPGQEMETAAKDLMITKSDLKADYHMK